MKTGASSIGVSLAESTDELMVFEDEDGNYSFVSMRTEAFEKLELPRDLLPLQTLYAIAE